MGAHAGLLGRTQRPAFHRPGRGGVQVRRISREERHRRRPRDRQAAATASTANATATAYNAAGPNAVPNVISGLVPSSRIVYAGTAVTVQTTFTNPGSTTPVDPDTVTLKFRVNNGTVTTWTYEGAGAIGRISQGVYTALLTTTGKPGTWTAEWVGTGACAAVSASQVVVTPAPL